MDRRIKRFGIGALAALLIVSMLAAPAAAADVYLGVCGPDDCLTPECDDTGCMGCRNETGAYLTGDGQPGTSDIGIVIRDVEKDGLDGFNASNPPYYLEGDDQFRRFQVPHNWLYIGSDDMGIGGIGGAIGDAPDPQDHIYIRTFNARSIEDATHYGDSDLYVVPGDDDHYFYPWNTTIEIPWGGETFEKELEPGWNLVSLPLTPDDNSTSAVLNSISGNYDAVMKYTPGTGFEAVTTTVMDPGVGYFIYMNTNGTWSYDGDSYDAMTAPLSQGLNMAGWVNDDVALPGALDSIAGDYNYVARWNATTQDYEVYEPDAPASFNDFGTIAKGEGYFIAAKTGCTLTYP